MEKIDLKPRVIVDGKGRILIPKWLREQLQIQKGDFFEVEVYKKGRLLFSKLVRPKGPPPI